MSRQLVIPGFKRVPEVSEEEKLYICACGNTRWSIFDGFIECAACGRKYEDCAMPSREFNLVRDGLLLGPGRGK